MNKYISTPDGRLVQVFIGGEGAPPSSDFVVSADLVELDKYYVTGGALVPMPPKPSEFHIFDYTTKQWVDPRTEETQWPIVRAERDKRLQASDWAALPDVPLTTEKRAEWTAYRQALRDVTLQEDPFNITWPIQPS